MIKYGTDWPNHWAEFQIELFLYRYPEKAAKIPECADFTGEDHFINARKLLWPKFKWSDYSYMFVHAWLHKKYIAVMGHTRGTKTFDFGYTVVTEYLADPQNTRIVLTTVGLDSLRNNLWSNVLEAINSTAIKLPLNQRATDREVCFSEDHKDRKYCIKGIATGEDKKAQGRIQGQHAPRSIVIIDEAQQTGKAIYDAMWNLASDPFFRGVFLGNPEDSNSNYGNVCEPMGGWETVDPSHKIWDTKMENGVCIHLDGITSPNYLAETDNPYPYLITKEYIESIRRNPGEDSKQWWAWVRGWWPPEGTVQRVFSRPVIDMGRKDIELVKARPCASLDPGYGGDRCILMEGEYGILKEDISVMGVRWVKTIEIPIKVGVGSEYNTADYQIRDYVIDYCKARRIQPDDLIIDGTSRGAAVVAMIRRKWNMAVHTVEYGGKPSERLLLPGDRRPCSKLYDRRITELWYAASEYMATGQFGNITQQTGVELYGREAMDQRHGPRREAQTMAIETKREYKKRLHRSPDLGDAACQFIELLRRKGAKLKGQTEWIDKSEERLDGLANAEEDIYHEELEYSY